MGVDKQNIRTVIHMEAPTSIESYLQESGRGGRDRTPARAILISSEREKDGPITDIIKKNTCRREALLNLLGAEIEYCSGCDICDGSYNSVAIGTNQIVQFLKKNPNQYNTDQSSRILKGYFTYDAMANQYHNTHGFGILAKWDLDSIKEAIKLLVETGKIKVSKNPFKKGVLKLND